MAATPVSESESRTVAAYEFPSSVLSSFSYWAKSFAWSAGSKAEESLVRRGLGGDIPLVSPDEASNVSGKRAVLHKVLLDGSEKDKKRWMRVLEIGNPQRAPDEHVVFFTHGQSSQRSPCPLMTFLFRLWQRSRLLFPTVPSISLGEQCPSLLCRLARHGVLWPPDVSEHQAR